VSDHEKRLRVSSSVYNSDIQKAAVSKSWRVVHPTDVNQNRWLWHSGNPVLAFAYDVGNPPMASGVKKMSNVHEEILGLQKLVYLVSMVNVNNCTSKCIIPTHYTSVKSEKRGRVQIAQNKEWLFGDDNSLTTTPLSLYVNFYPVEFDLCTMDSNDQVINTRSMLTVFAVACVYGAPGVNILKTFDTLCENGDTFTTKKLVSERQQLWKDVCTQQLGSAAHRYESTGRATLCDNNFWLMFNEMNVENIIRLRLEMFKQNNSRNIVVVDNVRIYGLAVTNLTRARNIYVDEREEAKESADARYKDDVQNWLDKFNEAFDQGCASENRILNLPSVIVPNIWDNNEQFDADSNQHVYVRFGHLEGVAVMRYTERFFTASGDATFEEWKRQSICSNFPSAIEAGIQRVLHRVDLSQDSCMIARNQNEIARATMEDFDFDCLIRPGFFKSVLDQSNERLQTAEEFPFATTTTHQKLCDYASKQMQLLQANAESSFMFFSRAVENRELFPYNGIEDIPRLLASLAETSDQQSSSRNETPHSHYKMHTFVSKAVKEFEEAIGAQEHTLFFYRRLFAWSLSRIGAERSIKPMNLTNVWEMLTSTVSETLTDGVNFTSMGHLCWVADMAGLWSQMQRSNLANQNIIYPWIKKVNSAGIDSVLAKTIDELSLLVERSGIHESQDGRTLSLTYLPIKNISPEAFRRLGHVKQSRNEAGQLTHDRPNADEVYRPRILSDKRNTNNDFFEAMCDNIPRDDQSQKNVNETTESTLAHGRRVVRLSNTGTGRPSAFATNLNMDQYCNPNSVTTIRLATYWLPTAPPSEETVNWTEMRHHVPNQYSTISGHLENSENNRIDCVVVRIASWVAGHCVGLQQYLKLTDFSVNNTVKGICDFLMEQVSNCNTLLHADFNSSGFSRKFRGTVTRCVADNLTMLILQSTHFEPENLQKVLKRTSRIMRYNALDSCLLADVIFMSLKQCLDPSLITLVHLYTDALDVPIIPWGFLRKLIFIKGVENLDPSNEEEMAYCKKVERWLKMVNEENMFMTINNQSTGYVTSPVNSEGAPLCNQRIIQENLQGNRGKVKKHIFRAEISPNVKKHEMYDVALRLTDAMMMFFRATNIDCNVNTLISMLDLVSKKSVDGLCFLNLGVDFYNFDKFRSLFTNQALSKAPAKTYRNTAVSRFQMDLKLDGAVNVEDLQNTPKGVSTYGFNIVTLLVLSSFFGDNLSWSAHVLEDVAERWTNLILERVPVSMLAMSKEPNILKAFKSDSSRGNLELRTVAPDFNDWVSKCFFNRTLCCPSSDPLKSPFPPWALEDVLHIIPQVEQLKLCFQKTFQEWDRFWDERSLLDTGSAVPTFISDILRAIDVKEVDCVPHLQHNVPYPCLFTGKQPSEMSSNEHFSTFGSVTVKKDGSTEVSTYTFNEIGKENDKVFRVPLNKMLDTLKIHNLWVLPAIMRPAAIVKTDTTFGIIEFDQNKRTCYNTAVGGYVIITGEHAPRRYCSPLDVISCLLPLRSKLGVKANMLPEELQSRLCTSISLENVILVAYVWYPISQGDVNMADQNVYLLAAVNETHHQHEAFTVKVDALVNLSHLTRTVCLVQKLNRIDGV
jgi:hypothetical protein